MNINTAENDYSAGMSTLTGSSLNSSSSSSSKSLIYILFFTTPFLIASSLLLLISPLGSWRYFLAGGLCASVSHAVTTPIDVVKTRQQVDEGDYVKNKTKDRLPNDVQGKGEETQTHHSYGVWKTCRVLVKSEGWSVLLRGLGPTTVGYVAEGALKFGTYEVLKPLALNVVGSRAVAFSIAGAAAGAAAGLVLCPMEALRIRLVSEPSFGGGGWLEAGRLMMEREGPRGFMKGCSAMLAKQVPYTVVKQVTFDLVARAAYGQAGGKDGAKFAVVLFSAAAASVMSCLASQPGDMLLSVVNAHKGKSRARDFARKIRAEDGLGGFFTGLRARLVHVGAIVTLQLVIYDAVKRLCGLAATGMA